MPQPHHVAELPSTTIDPHIPEFFTKFYELSDDPETHDEYTRSFTDNATVIMGRKKVEGSADVC